MLKKPAIWAEIGEIDGFIAIFYSSKMKWKSNFSKSLNSSNQPWFIWIVFWILHSKTLQKTCILQNWKKNHELHTLNMLWERLQKQFWFLEHKWYQGPIFQNAQRKWAFFCRDFQKICNSFRGGLIVCRQKILPNLGRMGYVMTVPLSTLESEFNIQYLPT